MQDILALLQPIEKTIGKITLRQMSRIILALLAMTGRITMLGVSRWAGKGGSYRTVQRWYQTALPWTAVFWIFFQKHLWQSADTHLLVGDEVVASKSGDTPFPLRILAKVLIKDYKSF